MVIWVGTDGYQISQVILICRDKHHEHVSTGGLVLDIPNGQQSQVQNNAYTRLKDAGTFLSIRYNIMGHILV